MRISIILLSIVLALPCVAQSEMTKKPDLSKVASLDATITTLYEVISGPAGQKRDWELFKYLFKPDARLMPIRDSKKGTDITYLPPQGYIDASGAWLEKNGFFEKEIKREVQTFGALTQVFSTYEAFKTEKDATPFMRGINSIQLMNDGERWWVLNIAWFAENKEHPLPEKYLPKQ